MDSMLQNLGSAAGHLEVLFRKESSLYLGGWQPGEKEDSCSRTNSKDST